MKTYNPHPKQEVFHKCAANEILYGGAAGPGKSHALRHEGLTWCMRIPGLHVYLFRRTFPDLEKNHIIPSLEEFPHDIGKYRDQKKRWEFKNVSMLHFCHAQYEKDVFHFWGAEIHLLLVDELTTFTQFMYQYLRARVRCTLDIPEKYKHKIPGVATGSNPGGIGHEFVKRTWVDPDPYKEMKLIRAPKNEGGMLRCYIPGLLKDNPTLTVKDPTYVDRLDGLPEPYRTAYKEGDWDIFMGQAFNFGPRHLIKPIPIPEFSPLYMTFDWGFGAPFSVGFWWVDADNRLYRFSEWYGWNGTPGQGLRLTDEQIAEGINQRKKHLGLEGKEIIEICDPTCFNKKPDYKGGGQGPSTAEIFKHGKDSNGKEYEINLRPGDPSRDLKLRQFHSRLRLPEDENELPMMVVYDTCEQFRRTIPLLQTNPLNVEDIDTTMEDHCFDSQTEILTQNGWKLFSELGKYERVATLNNDNKVEYQIPYEFINQEYNGKMYLYDGRINFLVTDKHRFPIISRHYHQNTKTQKWKHTRVDKINDDCWIPRTAKKVIEFPSSLTCKLKSVDNPNANNVNEINFEDFYRYYGLWLAEGCIGNGSPTHYSVHIDQKADISDFIKPLGYRFHKYKVGSNCWRYTIQSKQFYDFIKLMSGVYAGLIAKEKGISRGILMLPSNCLKALYEGMIFGDGSVNRGMQTYSTASKQLADDFQELLFHLGMVGNIKKYEQKHTHILGREIKSKVPYYRIHVLKHDKAMIVKDKIKKEKYSGKVYCVRVPNETIYVRRNGTPYWSSNCYDEAALICMARPIGVDDGKVKKIIQERQEKAKLEALDDTSRQFWEKDFAPWKQDMLEKQEWERTGGMW